MHVVHVIARLNDGGPARVLAALGAELARRGQRVTVLAGRCATDEPDLTEQIRAAGITVETLPALGRRLSPLRDVDALLTLTARLRALAPDVVHTHTAKAGALGRLAARWLHLLCVHTYHGHVLHGYFSPALSRVARDAERLFAGAHHHQALTPSQADDLATRCGIGRGAHWQVLPIPVVPVTPVASGAAAWHAQLERTLPVVGFLGRLVAVKDGALFLRTIAALNRQRPIQGLICGDGDQREVLERLAKRLDFPVLFTGFVTAGEALGVMRVLLMSSRNEGLPLTAIEAGGAGVPVVAPAVGGLADVIRWGGASGAARTPTALAAACARLLDDGVERTAAITGGIALAARLTPAALAPAYEALYGRVRA